MNSTQSPFDDASGKQLLPYLASQGGAASNVQDVAAAGTTIDDATSLNPGFANISSVAASTGVRLSAATPVGQIAAIFNSDSGDAVKVYPPNATSKISAGADGAAVSVAAGAAKLFWRVSETKWMYV